MVVSVAPTERTAGAAVVYGAGLVALFAASGLYRRWPGPARFKPLLQRIDHGTIYVFIAATCTPIALVLHGAVLWIILVAAWAGAAAGVGLRLGWLTAPRTAVAGSYLLLGWLAVIAIPNSSACSGRRRWRCSVSAA